MIVKKRQLLTATLIIALGAAVAVNWYYTDNDNIQPDTSGITTVSVSGNLGDSLLVNGTVSSQVTQSDENSSSYEYFADAKITRNQTNDKIADKINEIADKDSFSTDDKEKIIKLLNEYKSVLKSQTDSENLIKAKTGSDCIVVISEDSCQVIMEKNSLNDTVIMQISEIIEKNTNISAENLIIIESK